MNPFAPSSGSNNFGTTDERKTSDAEKGQQSVHVECVDDDQKSSKTKIITFTRNDVKLVVPVMVDDGGGGVTTTAVGPRSPGKFTIVAESGPTVVADKLERGTKEQSDKGTGSALSTASTGDVEANPSQESEHDDSVPNGIQIGTADGQQNGDNKEKGRGGYSGKDREAEDKFEKREEEEEHSAGEGAGLLHRVRNSLRPGWWKSDEASKNDDDHMGDDPAKEGGHRSTIETPALVEVPTNDSSSKNKYSMKETGNQSHVKEDADGESGVKNKAQREMFEDQAEPQKTIPSTSIVDKLTDKWTAAVEKFEDTDDQQHNGEMQLEKESKNDEQTPRPHNSTEAIQKLTVKWNSAAVECRRSSDREARERATDETARAPTAQVVITDTSDAMVGRGSGADEALSVVSIESSSGLASPAKTRLSASESGHPFGTTQETPAKQHGATASSNGGVLINPTFQIGDVRCCDITTTSVRVSWSKPADKRYPAHAYRVSTAEVGSGFEVTFGQTPPSTTECMIVGLKPGRQYHFHVAPISAENMLVPGASVVSPPVTLLEAAYEKAWFFESSGLGGGENPDSTWTAYEGLGPDCAGAPGGGGGTGAASAVDNVRCSSTNIRCFTGLESLCLTVPPGLVGGAFVDAVVKEGWLYVVKARVFHEQAPPSGVGIETTRLTLWDMRHVKKSSPSAVKAREWELLECEIVPLKSEKLRVAIQAGGEVRGDIYVDAVELHHGGPTPAERALTSVLGVLDNLWPTPSKVKLRIESAENLEASDTMGTSDPYVKVYVGDNEVHRTKVIPMTLSPIWNETFVVSPPEGGENGQANVQGFSREGSAPPWAMHLEVWDHDARGTGDCLGDVRLNPEELAASPPHRKEHLIVDYRSSANTNSTSQGKGGGGAQGRGGKTTGKGTLALALQVSWPEDPTDKEGKLVETLMDEGVVLAIRVEALQELSLAALREPRDIEGAAREKETLLRARAPEAAVWVLSEEEFIDDSCRLLLGLIKLGRGAGGTEAGFNLVRRLQRHVLLMSPAVVVVRCIRGNVGQAETLLELLAKLYAGQQAALHEDAVGVSGLFYCIVLHVETVPAAQALMREICGGRRELSPGLIALFRRHRTRIPPYPGLWRNEVLSVLGKEEACAPGTEWDDIEAANEESFNNDRSKKPESVCRTMLKNAAVLVFAIPPLLIVVIAIQRISSEHSCEQPVATVMLLDGLVLLAATLGGGGFQANARCFSAIAGTWLFPIMSVACLAHVLLVALLFSALVSVDYVGTHESADARKAGGESEESCSRGTYVWGMLYLVLNLLSMVAPPTIMCIRCWNRMIQPPTSSAVATVNDDENEHIDDAASEKGDDEGPSRT